MNLRTCSDRELRALVHWSESWCDRAQQELDRRERAHEFAGGMTAGRGTLGRWDVRPAVISGRPAVAGRLPSRTPPPAFIFSGAEKEDST